MRLGQVADRVSRAPGLKPVVVEFYQKCALDPDLPTSVRALCLNRALRIYAELHQKVWEFDRDQIPDRVLELAKRL